MAATTIVNPSTLAFTTAGFRLWGSAISTAIAAVGWTQTADTGQVNWTTVTAPGANVTTVYEVWKMADSLQATDPCFIRINYMIASSGGPRMQITVGTNSDGAGAITSAANTGVSVSAASEVFNVNTTPLPAAVAHNSYVNGDTSSLVLLLHPLANGLITSGGLFVIERRRNVDGTPAAGGFQALWHPSTTTQLNLQTIYTNNLYAQPAVATGVGGPCYTGRASANATAIAVRANAVPLFPCFTGSYPEFGAPSKWLLGAYASDILVGTTFTATHFGGTQTFFACGAWNTCTTTSQFSSSASGFLSPCVRID